MSTYQALIRDNRYPPGQPVGAQHLRPPARPNLSIGTTRLSVPPYALSPPGTSGERALCASIERAHSELAKALARYPGHWQSLIERMPESESLRATRLFFGTARMSERGKAILVRKLMLALEQAGQSDDRHLMRMLEVFRLSPAFCTQLYLGLDSPVDAPIKAAYDRWRQAVNALAERFYLLAMKLVWQRSVLEHEQDELFSRATASLIAAAERHQPALGSFSAYAYRHIELGLLSSHKDIERSTADPDPERMLEQTQHEQQHETQSQFEIQQHENGQLIESAMQALDCQERQVIQALFQGNSRIPQSASGLARQMGLTKGRISQIKTQALKKMRTALESQGLTSEGVL